MLKDALNMGFKDNEVNVDHVLARAPNTQLSASRCRLEMDDEKQIPWDKPLVLLLNNFHEAPMQPFPPNSEIMSKHGAVISHQDDITSLEEPSSRDEKSDNISSNGLTETASHKPKLVTSQMRGKNSNVKTGGSGFFFRPKATFHVSVYLDGNRDEKTPDSQHVEYACVPNKLGKQIGSGRLTLNDTVYVDSEAMNKDPFKKVDKINEWRHEFDQIGRELDEESSSSTARTSFR